MYDIKGRFVLHAVGAAEGNFKLARVAREGVSPKGIPYIATHVSCTEPPQMASFALLAPSPFARQMGKIPLATRNLRHSEWEVQLRERDQMNSSAKSSLLIKALNRLTEAML